MAKIGIDARMYGKEQTGIGGYVKFLLAHLSELDPKTEYKIFLRSPYFDSYNSSQENLEKVKVESRWYSWSEQIVLPGRILKKRCDLVHFTHFSHPVFYPGDFVVTIHDLTPLYYPGRSTTDFRRWAYKRVVESACRRAKVIITPSQYTKKDIRENFKVPEEKIRVIYEGVKYKSKLEKINQDLDSEKQKVWTELSKNHPRLKRDFIFYTGVWRYHKNIEGLLKAFKLLAEEKDNYQLVLGGGRKEKDIERIKRKIAKLGLEDRVFCPGFLSEQELKKFYRAAAIFVLPSFYEGFGLVPLEALSQGTPVCCSNAGPLPEILGDCALYFDPRRPQDIAEKLASLLENEKLRLSLLAKAASRLKEFSWRKMTKKTLEVYKNCLL